MPSLLQTLLLRPALGNPRCWRQERKRRKEDFPFIKDQIRDHVGKLDTHRSMGSDGMHPQVLSGLAGAIAEPLSIILEMSWRTGEVPEDWRKTSVTPVFRKTF